MNFPWQFLLATLIRDPLMAKNKKKHSKKALMSEGILDVAHLSVRKFRKVTKEISKLSTGQKLVGGVALLAAGLTYLATRPAGPEASLSGQLRALVGGTKEPPKDPADGAEDEAAEPADAEAAPPRSRKGRKSK